MPQVHVHMRYVDAADNKESQETAGPKAKPEDGHEGRGARAKGISGGALSRTRTSHQPAKLEASHLGKSKEDITSVKKKK